MKKLLLLSIILPLSLFSQNKINGVVKDSIDVIEFANVILQDENNKFIAGVVTDEKGAYSFNSKKGKYNISISFIGYEEWNKKILINDENVDLGSITLIESENILGEVIIATNRPTITREVDRLVFNVENSIASAGGDALNILKVAPGVQVQNDQISLIGKSGVNILIDGRILNLSGDDLSNFLKSISSDDIKKIEVITNPPAKYEAEGNSGLINIVYKKGRNNKWSNSITAAYIQTTYPAYSLRNTFSYKKNKIKFLANISGKIGDEAVIERSTILYPTTTWTDNGKRIDQQDYIAGRIALDYDINSKSSIGIQYLGNYKKPNIKDKSDLFINDKITNSLNSLVLSNGYNDKKNTNNSINAHYTRNIDTIGTAISIDLDYFNYKADQDRDFNSKDYSTTPVNTLISAINKSSQDINNYSAKIDIENPLEKINLSYGAKVSIIDNNNAAEFYDNSSGIPVLDLTQTDYFIYKENTQSAYINASKKLSTKWQTQIGLRLENTQTTGTSKTLNSVTKNKYTKLFPTFYLSYQKNDNNAFSLSYGKRINRPSYWEINPFRWYINNFSYSEGNPFLRPSFSDNFELSYSFKNKLTTSGFLSITSDGFSQVPTVDPITNNQVFVRRNYFTQYRYGVSESYFFNTINWLESYNQLYAYYIRSNFDTNTVNSTEQNGFAYYFRTNNSFILNTKKTIAAEMSFWYSSASNGGLYRTKQSSSLDLGIKFFLMNRDLQISAALNDVFRTSSPDASTFSNGIEQIYNTYYDNRYAKLAIRYKFGNKKVYVQERDVGNDDEKGRTGN